MQGIAVINEGNNKNSQIDIDFNIDLHLIPLPSNMPSMLPSYSVSPTMHPTSSPIIALAKNLEIWGKCISVLYVFLLTIEFFSFTSSSSSSSQAVNATKKINNANQRYLHNTTILQLYVCTQQGH